MRIFKLILVLFAIQTASAQNDKPNILWITCEDISPDLPIYGDKTAKTPNLDALAKESLVYDNAFAVVGVCAPTRSAIITGMQPISIGTMHMRTGKDVIAWGSREYEETDRTDIEGNPIRQYSAVIPSEVKAFTEYLRAEGYYCTNNPKTDYQFAAPISSWDENGRDAHWRGKVEGQPFFSVFNIDDTHESKLWKYSDKPLTVKPEDVTVPPYFPDNTETRKTIARHYSNIEIMDRKVGEIIAQLKEDGLYDNTIIFFYSDHGGPLPREKRAIYDSGLKIPFMIKGIEKTGRTDRMVSAIDFGPTVLSLAGIQPPEYLDGKAFAGEFDTNPRDFVLGTSDRFDEVTDRMRAIRTKDYLYIFNFYPEKTRYKDISYRMQVPMMPKLIEMRDNNELDSIQQQWFSIKGKEELYAVKSDPYNVNDISEESEMQEVLEKHREILHDYLFQHKDLGQMPENKLIRLMWPEGEQPLTKSPEANFENGKYSVSSSTPGSSIVYLVSKNENPDTGFDANWKLYTEPLKLEKGEKLFLRAERIGYQISEIVVVQPN